MGSPRTVLLTGRNGDPPSCPNQWSPMDSTTGNSPRRVPPQHARWRSHLWHINHLGDHDHAFFSSSSSVAPCAAPFLARRRRTCRRRPDRPRCRWGRCRQRTRLARFRAEQRPHLVEWPDPRDGHGNDQLRWQLGEFPRRKLHVLRQRRRRSCRHLPGREQRLGCHAGRERPEQRADSQPRRQDEPSPLLAADHVALHDDVRRRADRVRFGRGGHQHL
jgi:hypothetical protein